MPKEIRRILFSFPESTQALKDYAHKHEVSLPEGRIARVRLKKTASHNIHTMHSHAKQILREQNINDTGEDIIITLFNESSLEHDYVNISKAFIAAALIEYCINHKIMLPKEAQKSIELEELHICMDITFSTPSESEGQAILSLEEDD